MAVASNLTDISLCESLTDWAVSGGPTMGLKSIAANEIYPVEGTYCIGGDVDIETGLYLYDYYTANGNTALDMSSKHLLIWGMCITANFLDTKTNGGIRLVMEDGSGNQGYWYVAGSDTYKGGWRRFVIDGNSTPTANNGTDPTASNIYKVGISFKATAKSKLTENCLFDLVQYGSSTSSAITVTGGTSGIPLTWEDVLTGDAGLSKPAGVIRKVGGVYFVQGPITFGDTGTGDMYFQDDNALVIWEDTLAAVSYYDWLITGNSTGTTSFVLGSVSGSGDTRFGSGGGVVAAEGSHRWTIDAETNTANIDTFALYGLTALGAGVIQMDDNTNTQYAISCIFDNCSMVQPNEALILNSFFLNSVDTSGAVEMLDNDDDNIRYCTFRNTDNGVYFPSGETATRDFVGLDFDDEAGNYDVYNASGSAVTVSKSSGSNPNSYNASGSLVTFTGAAVTTQVTVKDLAAGTDISGARVLVWPTSGLNFPYQDSVSITGTGTTATVAHTAHGLATGDNVIISGANEDVYNGAYTITVTGVDAYTYTTSETISTSPATGTIVATFAFINDVTDGSGVASDTRVVGTDQPITGWVRKSTSSPYYQQGSVTGTTYSTSGYAAIIQLASDE